MCVNNWVALEYPPKMPGPRGHSSGPGAPVFEQKIGAEEKMGNAHALNTESNSVL